MIKTIPMYTLKVKDYQNNTPQVFLMIKIHCIKVFFGETYVT